MSTPFTFTPTRPFTPLSLSNCQLWLDASDPTTCLKSGSTVTAWNDKSGNGKNISITGTLTFSNATGNVGAANSVNTASGLTSYFTTPVDLRKSVTANASVFIVYAWLAAGGGATSQTFWGNDNPNSGNRVQHFDFNVYNPNAYGYYLNNGYLYNSTELNRSTTQMYELISQVGVTNGTGVYFNGSLGSAGFGSELSNTSYSGNEILFFGGGETSSVFPSYTQFNEIVVYSSALTQAERQQIEGYLAWKWGLVNLLPAQHPFRVTPPNATPNFQPVPFKSLQSFSPLYIPGCMFWIDAQDPTTVTSNAFSVITRVRDKSGNGYNLTNNMTTFGFTYNYEAFFNGSYPSFYNQNGAQTYTLGSNSSFSMTQPATLFTVHQIVGANTFQDIADGTDATNRFFIWYYVPSVPGVSLRLFAGTNIFSGASFNAGVYSYQVNSTSSYILQNGSTFATGDAGTNTCTGITIGSRYTQNSESFVGHICEVIYYSGILTTNQRQRVEGYLAWKWGLQGSLPATHPYRNSSNNNPGPYGPVYPFGQRKWLPSQVSGLQLWLDAADQSTLVVSGTSVTQWNDKSTNTYVFLPPATSNQPSYGIFNGYTGISFNGSANYLSNATTIQTGVGGRNTFIVFYDLGTVATNVYGQPGCMFINATPSYDSGNVWMCAFSGPSNAIGIDVVGGAKLMTTSPNVTSMLTTRCMAMWAMPNSATVTTAYVYGNGVQFTTAIQSTGTGQAINTGTGGGTTIASYPAVNWFTKIVISEILHYSTELTTAQRQQVEGYLAWKWGLQGSLSATHPFKYFPPSPS